MKRKTRLSSLLLSLIVVLGMMPISANAAGIQVYTDHIDQAVYSGGIYDMQVHAVGGQGKLLYNWELCLHHKNKADKWYHIEQHPEWDYFFWPEDSDGGHICMTTDWLDGEDMGSDWNLISFRCLAYDNYGNMGYSPEYNMHVYSTEALKTRIQEENSFFFTEAAPSNTSPNVKAGTAVDFVMHVSELTDWMKESEMTVRQYFEIQEPYGTSTVSGVHYSFQRYAPGNYTVVMHADLYCGSTVVSALSKTYSITVQKPAEHTITVYDGKSSVSSAKAGTTVTIQADSPRYSFMTFSGWGVHQGNVHLANSDASKSSFVMPDEDVVLSANYESDFNPDSINWTYFLSELHFIVEEPAAGNHPKKPEPSEDAYSVYDYVWLDGTKEMSSSDTFEAGKDYILLVDYSLGKSYAEGSLSGADVYFNERLTTKQHYSHSVKQGFGARLYIGDYSIMTYTCPKDLDAPSSGPAVESIQIEPLEKSVAPGDTFSLSATLLPLGAEGTVIYTSSDKSCAIVDETGFVEIPKDAPLGMTCIITADCEGNAAACRVSVINLASYMVSFDANGGAGTMEPASIPQGGVYTIPECIFMPPSGKVFDQWDQGAPGEGLLVTGNMTLKALWKDAGTTRTMPFTDVTPKDWFYDDVKTAYETYLIDGYTDTTYEPNKNLTYAQAVKLAACMHQRYLTGSVTLENAEKGKPWYETYVDYAKVNKIITKDYDWNAAATRAGYIDIFANALPAEAFKAKNTIADNAIPDVKMDHPQAAAVYKLYRAGILEGSDGGKFKPDDNIRRSEVAAILTRMMNKSARKTVTLG